MQPMIEVTGLTKSFGPLRAVDGVSFSVGRGELFAFLGVNGAGKSTTVSMLCTLLRPDGGSASLNGCALGREDGAIRRSIGMVFQQGLLDPLLTVRENLSLRARLYGLPRPSLGRRTAEAAQAAGCTEFLDRPYGKLSGGQRRRADIARALVHTPDILFLDEPTTGLDPQTRTLVWESLDRLRHARSTTIFLTTHDMEEAARADSITIIGHGRVLAQGAPLALKRAHARDVLRLYPKDQAALAAWLSRAGIAYRGGGPALSVPLSSTLDALDLLPPIRGLLQGFEVMNGSMNDVFLAVTGEGGSNV